MRFFRLIPFAFLVACGSASANQYEELVVDATPTSRAVAVAYAFMGCGEADDGNILKCQSCDVRQHDKDGNGIVTYATYWDLAFKRSDDGTWKKSVAGEHSDKSFKNSVSDFASSEDGWSKANAWCEEISGQKLKVLKDKREEFFGEPK